MANKVTIDKNPSRQSRDHKIMEVSFTIDGEYYGLLIGLEARGDTPRVQVYRIDEGIDVSVAAERDKRY